MISLLTSSSWQLLLVSLLLTSMRIGMFMTFGASSTYLVSTLLLLSVIPLTIGIEDGVLYEFSRTMSEKESTLAHTFTYDWADSIFALVELPF